AEQLSKLIPGRMLEAQEAERRRVARELHDGVSQMLASAIARVQAVEKTLERQDTAMWSQAMESRELLQKSLEEVRRISHDLIPSELEHLGLTAALRCLCGEFERRAGLPTKLKCSDIPGNLATEIRLPIFRIIQEALTNIEKHAKATKAG